MFFDFSRDGFLMGTTYNHKKKNDDYVLNSVFSSLSLDKDFLVEANQVHQDTVLTIDSPGLYDSCDGFITESKLILLIKTADCVPVFIYDKNKKIFGMIHAGWRGVQKKIHVNALNKFLDLKSDLKDIYVFLGPSIKQCCFEIKDDVVKLFDNKFIIKRNNSFYLDLNKCIIYDLLNMGLENVSESNICTYDNEKCHSYRKHGPVSGRMFSFITY